MLAWANRVLSMGNSSSQIQDLASDETWDSDDDAVQSQQNLRSSPPTMNKDKRKRKRAGSSGDGDTLQPQKRPRNALAQETTNNAAERATAVVGGESSTSNNRSDDKPEKPKKRVKGKVARNPKSEAEEEPLALPNDRPVGTERQDNGSLQKGDSKVKKARKSKAGLEPQTTEEGQPYDRDASAAKELVRPQGKRKSKAGSVERETLAEANELNDREKSVDNTTVVRTNNARKCSQKPRSAETSQDHEVPHTPDLSEATGLSQTPAIDGRHQTLSDTQMEPEQDHNTDGPVDRDPLDVSADPGEQERHSRQPEPPIVNVQEGTTQEPQADNVPNTTEKANTRKKSWKDGKKRRQTTSYVSAEKIVDSDSDAEVARETAAISSQWTAVNESRRHSPGSKKVRQSTHSDAGSEEESRRASNGPSRSGRQRRLFTCPAPECTQTRDRVARLAKHVEQAHPDLKFDPEAFAAPKPRRREPATPTKSVRKAHNNVEGSEDLPAVFADGPDWGPWNATEIRMAEAVFQATCQSEQISTYELKSRINQWSDIQVFKKNMEEALPNRKSRSRREFSQRHWHIGERGKWTPEEDEALREAAIATPGKWAQVGKELERPSSDCAARWKNALQRAQTRLVGSWTKEEVRRLRAAVEECIRELQAHAELTDDQKEDRDFLETNMNWNYVADKLGNTREPRRCRVKWVEVRSKEEKGEAEDDTPTPTSHRKSAPAPLSASNSRIQQAAKDVEQQFGFGDLFDCMVEIYQSFDDPDAASYDDEKNFWARVALVNKGSKFTTHYRRVAYNHLYEKAKHRRDVRDAPTIATCAGILAKWIKREAKSNNSDLSRIFGPGAHNPVQNRSRARKDQSKLHRQESIEDGSPTAQSSLRAVYRAPDTEDTNGGAESDGESNDAEDVADIDNDGGDEYATGRETSAAVDPPPAEAMNVDRESTAGANAEDDEKDVDSAQHARVTTEDKDTEMELEEEQVQPNGEAESEEDRIAEAITQEPGDQEDQEDPDTESEEDERASYDRNGTTGTVDNHDEEGIKDQSTEEASSSSSGDDEESESSSEEDDSLEPSAADGDGADTGSQPLPEENGTQNPRQATLSPVKDMVNGTKKPPVKNEGSDSDSSSSDESEVGDESAIEAMMRLRNNNKRQRFGRY